MKSKYNEAIQIEEILSTTNFKFNDAKEVLKFTKLKNEISEKIKEYEKSFETIMTSFKLVKNPITQTYEIDKNDKRLIEINKMHEALLNEELELTKTNFFNEIEFEAFLENNIDEKLNIKNITILENFLVKK